MKKMAVRDSDEEEVKGSDNNPKSTDLEEVVTEGVDENMPLDKIMKEMTKDLPPA